MLYSQKVKFQSRVLRACMIGSVSVIAKKLFSLSLILNSLLTLVFVAEFVFNSYRDFPYWQPFSPYLFNGSVFFLVIVAALVNIFPSASVGRYLQTGRFLFHHYVYGCFVLGSSTVYVVFFASVSFFTLFLVYSSNVAVNAGRFFLLAGFTLFLDDLPDVSKRVDVSLNRLKSLAYRGRRVIYMLQLFTGFASFYVFLAVSLWASHHLEWAAGGSFMIGSFLVTSLTSFAFVRRKEWLKIAPTK